MIREFKEFIDKGSFIDLAVAFVMGLSVAALITALVERLLMPVIALAVGQPNFESIGTFGDNGSAGAVITAFVNFLLVAVVLFLIVKAYNRMQRTKPDEPDDPAPTPEEVMLLREIRDSLHRQA